MESHIDTVSLIVNKPIYPKFSDFNPSQKLFDGKKVSIEDILNKDILIKAFKVGASKYKPKEYVTVQFNYINEQPNENFIFFTGSGVIKDQLIQNKDHLPFYTLIKKIDKYYILS
jgi:hypothetical protein